MRTERDQPFGVGLGLGIVLGFILGSILVARLGDAAELLRPMVDRMLRRKEGVRFEVLIQ